MRYRPGQLPEIVAVSSRDNFYFASIRLARGDVDRIFETGITNSSYNTFKRIFQSRPFDDMPGLKARYYFVPAFSKRNDPERCIGTVRIEQGKDGRDFEFEMPKTLIANLLWFFEMKDLKDAQHLRSWHRDKISTV
jgi:hypothetical protein